jgi:cellulose synthase/poly-beta-1,6-N-acetylglucosamine synthase-like glycosyltransferase
LLSVYGIYRYRLVYLFLRYKNHRPQPKSRFAAGRLPRVTVQLPLFNEMYVAERLIEAVVNLEYPRELLEIQVLDDSTDDTQQIASAAVNKYFEQGFDIVYHHREDRVGFKAGALEAGLKKSSGEFVLIFDADFVPRPDCIRRMIDYFTDERSEVRCDGATSTPTTRCSPGFRDYARWSFYYRAGGAQSPRRAFNFNGWRG